MKYLIATLLMTPFFALAEGVENPAVESETPAIAILVCRDARNLADAGYGVDIRYPLRPGSVGRKGLLASVSEETLMGSKLMGVFEVVRLQDSALGAPVKFIGNDFELDVLVDTAPVHGAHLSHLKARVEGAEIVQDLYCQFVK